MASFTAVLMASRNMAVSSRRMCADLGNFALIHNAAARSLRRQPSFSVENRPEIATICRIELRAVCVDESHFLL
jgi:hypothetical protein